VGAKDDRIAALEEDCLSYRQGNDRLRERNRQLDIQLTAEKAVSRIHTQPTFSLSATPKVKLDKYRSGWRCEVVGGCKTFVGKSSFRWLARHRANRDRARYVKAHKAS